MSNLNELRQKFGGRITKQEHLDGNVRTIRSTQNLRGAKVNGIKIKVHDFGDFYTIGFDVNTDTYFSINIPNTLHVGDTRSNMLPVKYPVYLPQLKQAAVDKVATFIDHTADFLNNLNFSPDEGLFIYATGVSLIADSRRNILELLKEVTDFFHKKENIFEIPSGRLKTPVEGLPPHLQSLSVLISEWAIPDDTERSDAIDNMTVAQKQMLIEAVMPLMKDINAYLDSFEGNAMPEIAIAVGNLAELVSELSLERN